MPDKEESTKDASSDALTIGHSLTPFFTSFFKALLLPITNVVGKALGDSLQERIERQKAYRRNKNLNIHIEQVTLRLGDQVTETPPPIATEQQADFFSDWASSVQDIDPADKELSRIWQDLMIRVALGKDVSADLLHAVKNLTPGEARFLIRLREKSVNEPWLFPFQRLTSENVPFYTKSLKNKQLVERPYRVYVVVLLFITLFYGLVGYYVFKRISWKWVPTYEDRITRFLMVMVILSCFAFPLAVFVRRFAKLRLSWLGRELMDVTDKVSK